MVIKKVNETAAHGIIYHVKQPPITLTKNTTLFEVNWGKG